MKQPMVNKVDVVTREKALAYIYNQDYGSNYDDSRHNSAETIAELYRDGCVGYKDKSDEELLQYLARSLRWLSDEHEESELLAIVNEFKAQIVMYDKLAEDE